MVRLFFLWVIVGITPGIIYSQSSVTKFDVFMNGEKVGTLTATKNVSGRKVIKNISSTTNTKVFFLSLHVESEIYATMENEILANSFAYRHINRGSENIETTVKKISPTQYKVVKNGETRMVQNDAIRYCVVDLYFKEPKEISSVFSNTHGEFLVLEKLKEGEYQLLLPDGKRNVFTYVGGKLLKVEASVSIGQVIFKRR